MTRRAEVGGGCCGRGPRGSPLAEETGHVEVGSRWFAHLCTERHVEPEAEFRRLLDEHGVTVRPPANVEARLRGGFNLVELEVLGLA